MNLINPMNEFLFTRNPSFIPGVYMNHNQISSEFIDENQNMNNPSFHNNKSIINMSKIENNIFPFTFYNKLHNDIIDYSNSVENLLKKFEPIKINIIQYLENLINDTFGKITKL